MKLNCSSFSTSLLQFGNMARRALKLASWTSMALAASGFYLYSNKYLDPNDFGAVRVGRAVATVGVFFSIGGRKELSYYMQVFIYVADGHAGHTFVELHMYLSLYVQSSLYTVAQAWIYTLSFRHPCIHNLCRPEVKESRIVQDLCVKAYILSSISNFSDRLRGQRSSVNT